MKNPASLAAALLLAAPAPAIASRPPFVIVAASGQQAPGLPPGFTIDTLGAGILSSAGHTGFSARVLDEDGRNVGRGFFIGVPSDLHLATLTGQPTPGIDGGNLTSLERVRINAAGQVAAQQGYLLTGGAPAYGIWAGPPGALSPVAHHGGQAPDLPPGTRFEFGGAFDRLTLGDGGHAVFTSRLSGPGVTQFDDSAVFRSVGGETRLIAREGMTHPVLGPDVAIGHLGFIKVVAPRVNARGDIALSTFLVGPDHVPTGESVMLRAGDGGLHLVARTGQPLQVPGVPDAHLGRFMHYLADGLINNAGQIAFGTHLAGQGITSQNDEAIVVSQPGGQLDVIAREGDPLPGLPGYHIGPMSQLRFGGGGHAAFHAYLRADDGGSVRSAIVVASDDGVRTAALLGGPVPGLPDGYTLDGVNLDSMAANARGQLVFHGSASIPGQPGTLAGVFAFDPLAGLFPVLLSGDTIELAPGDTRPVLSALIAFQEFEGNTGGQDGMAGNLNDLGQVILHARLPGNATAVILTTIPSPAAGAALCVLLGCSARRRRRGGS